MTSHDASLPDIAETLLQFDKVLASDVKASQQRNPFGDLFGVFQMAALHLGLSDVPRGGTHRLGATVEEMASAFGLIVREVALYGDWWNHDIGTAIGLQTDLGLPVLMRSNLKRGGMEFCKPGQGGEFHPLTQESALELQSTVHVLHPALPFKSNVWECKKSECQNVNVKLEITRATAGPCTRSYSCSSADY
jgi:hypothetical protein